MTAFERLGIALPADATVSAWDPALYVSLWLSADLPIPSLVDLLISIMSLVQGVPQDSVEIALEY